MSTGTLASQSLQAAVWLNRPGDSRLRGLEWFTLETFSVRPWVGSALIFHIKGMAELPCRLSDSAILIHTSYWWETKHTHTVHTEEDVLDIYALVKDVRKAEDIE